MRLGANLEELRERKGATRTQVAAAICVSEHMIWRLEKGRMKKSTSTVVAKPADCFGGSVEELLGEFRRTILSLMSRACCAALVAWTHGTAS